jgi:hypothetical protein
MTKEAFSWASNPPEPSSRTIVEYMAHLADTGDTEYVVQPAMCGSEGENRPMEGFAIRLVSGSQPVGLRYKIHMADLGDSGSDFSRYLVVLAKALIARSHKPDSTVTYCH